MKNIIIALACCLLAATAALADSHGKPGKKPRSDFLMVYMYNPITDRQGPRVLIRLDKVIYFERNPQHEVTDIIFDGTQASFSIKYTVPGILAAIERGDTALQPVEP